ncbi:hypothetical protein I302_103030 [Kwoniella bestiolae CBS 10118]|uniref:Uncharacterized protein n=1 Tax=Kwoniella bestiolae CBS 10118 TaxID=1296100 RepID=A0A1B9GGV6_9TREE|nr:hypothetical protein I302_01726 [Kwoniella bestiolae CBS 10118]OCF30207.1 hypothetical protein I302_01726 [Kwoniella bestiolae CBS 10118]
MGTRGLIGFVIRGKRRGCYVQFDSYPEGMGVGIVKFILGLTPEQIQSMVKRLEEIIWVESGSDAPPEIVEKYKSLDFHLSTWEKHMRDTQPNYWRITQDHHYEDQPNGYYAICRGIQGAYCLPYILDGSLKHLIDNFLMDDGKERSWKFDQLNSGFWGKLVDDNLQRDRGIERRRKEKEMEEEKKKKKREEGEGAKGEEGEHEEHEEKAGEKTSEPSEASVSTAAK